MSPGRCPTIRREHGRQPAAGDGQRPRRRRTAAVGRNALTMTAGSAAGTRVTVAEIAAARGISVRTVRRHHCSSSRWPRAVGTRPSGDRGRPPLEWDAAAVDDFYRWKEAASAQGRRGPRRRPGEWDLGELVGAATAAERLHITESALRGYVAGTKGSRNPFPPPVIPGRWRWGDIVKWDDRRPGSGNHLAGAERG
jgi:hypothetical protein